LQEVCDAVETIVNDLGGIRLYSEAEEKPTPPRAGVTGELQVEDARRLTSCGGTRAVLSVVISTPIGDTTGWGGATRRIRPFMELYGDSSIVEALMGEANLGIVGESVSIGNFTTGRERTVPYADGDRRVASVSFEVLF
jgi:hypothetical protein